MDCLGLFSGQLQAVGESLRTVLGLASTVGRSLRTVLWSVATVDKVPWSSLESHKILPMTLKQENNNEIFEL